MKNFNRAKTILEFDKILALVSSCAPTEGSREKIALTEPVTDCEIVCRLQRQTEDAKEMMVTKAFPPFGNVKNIVPFVERAEKGSVLTPRELLDIAALLRSVSSLITYSASKDGCGSLTEFFSLLQENKFLEKKISMAITAEDIIADSASNELFALRKEMRKCESNVRDILSKYTSGYQSKYLQESIVTMRSGRYVIPVKAEYRNEVKGLLHDTSASGATLFIEPLAVLEANNKLRSLKAAEEIEINRILAELSDEVTRFSSLLSLNYKVITDLGVIFARAEFAYRINGINPVITDGEKIIKLINARHPLLSKGSVVPVSLEFGGEVSTLVITGPNTGGKTVTLKTIGLMAMMAQSGFQLPCDYGTKISVFSSVLPDIGDEQSIEQSLSTFSAHMVNIVNILDTADKNSLVLFDELGAGTDPVEGAALAISILERVKALGALTAATTHYAEIKTYALEDAHVQNASCEFDVETLRPTYRLVLGIPGKSNAFAISSRLGLSDEIIEYAKQWMKTDNIKFEDVLSKLEETESKLLKEKTAAEKAKAEAEEILRTADKKAEEINEKAEKELKKAKEQAISILNSAKASSDYIFDMLNRLQKEKDKADIMTRISETRKAVRAGFDKADKAIDLLEDKEPEEEYVLPRPLVAGDAVIIKNINKQATVISTDGKTALVQAGIVKTKVSLNELRLIAQPKKEKSKSETVLPHNRDAVKQEIDLRGLTGDDAWFMVDRFIDEALGADYKTITLIHGKGTGALRAALWTYLKNDKRIRSYRSGRYGEGETGVTICELKV